MFALDRMCFAHEVYLPLTHLYFTSKKLTPADLFTLFTTWMLSLHSWVSCSKLCRPLQTGSRGGECSLLESAELFSGKADDEQLSNLSDDDTLWTTWNHVLFGQDTWTVDSVLTLPHARDANAPGGLSIAATYSEIKYKTKTNPGYHFVEQIKCWPL